MPLPAVMFGTSLTGTDSRLYSLFIDGLDVIRQPGNPGNLFGVDVDSVVLHEVLGRPPLLTFTVDDPANAFTPDPGADIYFCDHEGMVVAGETITEDLFRGTIVSRNITTRDGSILRRWEIQAIGLENLLDRRVIPEADPIPAGAKLVPSIQRLMADVGDPRLSSLMIDPTHLYATSSNTGRLLTDTDSSFATINTSVSISGKTLRQALKLLAENTNRSDYWADYQTRAITTPVINTQGRLHFCMSVPNDLPRASLTQGTGAHATKPAMERLLVEEDRSGLVNAVYVRGVDDTSSGWVVDDTSIATYGRLEAILDAPRAVDSTSRDAIGRQYLNQHVTVRRIKFSLLVSHVADLTTNKSGWHPRHGMQLLSTNDYWPALQGVTMGILNEVTYHWKANGQQILLDLVFESVDRSAAFVLTQQTADAFETSLSAQRLEGTLGEVALRVKAGTPTDADFDSPRDGFVVVDTSASKIWTRVSGTWKGVTVA